MSNHLLKDPVYDWEVEKEWIWQDDAACAFSPPTLFEVAFPGDPVTKGLETLKEVHDLNETNLKAARKICNSCPVIEQCREDLVGEDLRWTMRAGIMPTSHNITALGRPAKNVKCPSGHENWTTDRNGHRRCSTCEKERSIRQAEEQKAQRAAEGRTKRSKVGQPRGIKCHNQHDDWISRKARKEGQFQWDCLPCKRDRDAENKRIKRAEAAKVEG